MLIYQIYLVCHEQSDGEVTEEEMAQIHSIDTMCLVVCPVIYAICTAVILRNVDE